MVETITQHHITIHDVLVIPRAALLTAEGKSERARVINALFDNTAFLLAVEQLAEEEYYHVRSAINLTVQHFEVCCSCMLSVSTSPYSGCY